MILIVTFALSGPAPDRAKVEALLQASSGGFFRATRDVWLVDTRHPPAWWRGELAGAVDHQGTFFVARLQQQWGSFGPQSFEWLNESRRRW